MKIGIFGGTFDPFTKAHKEIVDETLKIVDKIIIVPTTISYYRDGKSPLFSFEQRCEIIEAAIDTYWDWERVSISELEKDKDSFWRTADTIRCLKKNYPSDELYFILGSDSFDSIDTWRDSDYLKENLKFIVVDGRNGVKSSNNFPHETITIHLSDTSASDIRKSLVGFLVKHYIEWVVLND